VTLRLNEAVACRTRIQIAQRLCDFGSPARGVPKSRPRTSTGRQPTSDLSIKARVEHYRTDLETRGRDPNNASRVLFHLAGTKLANRLLTASSLSEDPSEFRDHLAAKGPKPATIDRINRAFKAALNLTAENDQRITRRPWKAALKAIVGEEAGARNVFLDDADRTAFRGAAYRDSGEAGLLIDVLDETGARQSQVVRLTAEDVQADFIDRRTGRLQSGLMMPVSRKGSGKRLARSTPVPITPELADRLKGRSGVLLKRADGTRCGQSAESSGPYYVSPSGEPPVAHRRGHGLATCYLFRRCGPDLPDFSRGQRLAP
jgi:integrase